MSHFLTGCQLAAAFPCLPIHFQSQKQNFPHVVSFSFFKYFPSGRAWFFARVRILRSCPPRHLPFLYLTVLIQHNVIRGVSISSYSEGTPPFEKSGRNLGAILEFHLPHFAKTSIHRFLPCKSRMIMVPCFWIAVMNKR